MSMNVLHGFTFGTCNLGKFFHWEQTSKTRFKNLLHSYWLVWLILNEVPGPSSTQVAALRSQRSPGGRHDEKNAHLARKIKSHLQFCGTDPEVGKNEKTRMLGSIVSRLASPIQIQKCIKKWKWEKKFNLLHSGYLAPDIDLSFPICCHHPGHLQRAGESGLRRRVCRVLSILTACGDVMLGTESKWPRWNIWAGLQAAASKDWSLEPAEEALITLAPKFNRFHI